VGRKYHVVMGIRPLYAMVSATSTHKATPAKIVPSARPPVRLDVIPPSTTLIVFSTLGSLRSSSSSTMDGPQLQQPADGGPSQSLTCWCGQAFTRIENLRRHQRGREWYFHGCGIHS
jgi:hypothetical protein